MTTKIIAMVVLKMKCWGVTHDFFALFDTGFDLWNVALGFIVENTGLDLVLANDGEVLLDGQLSLPKARTSLSSRHFRDKSAIFGFGLCGDRLRRMTSRKYLEMIIAWRRCCPQSWGSLVDVALLNWGPLVARFWNGQNSTMRGRQFEKFENRDGTRWIKHIILQS